MGYLAGKRIKIGAEWREPGDPVPEAEHFRNLRTLIEWGRIVEGDYPEGYEVPEIDPSALDARAAQKEREQAIMDAAQSAPERIEVTEELVVEEAEPVAEVYESDIEDEIEADHDEDGDEVSIEELLKMRMDVVLSALEEADGPTIEAVIQVERDGKNRSTLIKNLEQLLEEAE